MTHCHICGAVIDLEGDAIQDYRASFERDKVPTFTCGGCLEPDTESTTILTEVQG